MGSSRTPAVGFLPCLLKSCMTTGPDGMHFGPGFVCFWFNFVLLYTSNITTVHYIFMHSLNFTPLIPDCLMLQLFFLYSYILFINVVYYLHFLVCPHFCYVLLEPWGVIIAHLKLIIPLLKYSKQNMSSIGKIKNDNSI